MRSYSVDKPIIIKAHAVKYFTNLASHHHTCLPCQREVDWRQGTNLNIIAFTCDTLTIFILQTFLPSRRRDCHTTNLASHQPLLLHRMLPFPHNHCKRTTIPRSTLSLQNQNHALNAWYALALQGHNTDLCLKAH